MLIFSSIFVFILFIKYDNKLLIIILGFCLGSILLAKIDGLLILISIPFVLFYLKIKNNSRFNKNIPIFSSIFIFLFIQSILHGFYLSSPYTYAILKPKQIFINMDASRYLLMSLIIIISISFIIYKIPENNVTKILNNLPKNDLLRNIKLIAIIAITIRSVINSIWEN